MLTVRPMVAAETELIVDYFHGSTPKHLETMGVDRARLPHPDEWRAWLAEDFDNPPEDRDRFCLIWLADGRPVGFSTVDDIDAGDSARLHLHVLDLDQRAQGIGTTCLKLSVDIYFETLRLKRVLSEPNAFNVAPNRTLQKAGFVYVKTHMTVPGPLNFHQAVTRWMIER